MSHIESRLKPSGFVLFPANVLAIVVRIDWDQTQRVYRDAYEATRATLRPTITDRLQPVWN
jgi:hypothetical protein